MDVAMAGITQQKIDRIVRMYKLGTSIRRIVMDEHVGYKTVVDSLRASGVPLRVPEQQDETPTRDEIEQRCVEIQWGWSEEERRRRCVYSTPRVVVSVIEDPRPRYCMGVNWRC